MNIPITQHINQPLFPFGCKAALAVPGVRVLIGAEEHIPPYDIAIVVLVTAELVVNPMHLWPLKYVADPAGRSDVGVVEELTNGSKEGVDSARFNGQAQKRVDEQTTDDGVHHHFAGVLVERRDDLKPSGAVVNLVKEAPKHV